MRPTIQIDNEDPTKLYISYDEDMCVYPQSGFIKKMDGIFKKYVCRKINQLTLTSIECEIISLLRDMESRGYLFTGDILKILSKKPGMILLKASIDTEPEIDQNECTNPYVYTLKME